MYTGVHRFRTTGEHIMITTLLVFGAALAAVASLGAALVGAANAATRSAGHDSEGGRR